METERFIIQFEGNFKREMKHGDGRLHFCRTDTGRIIKQNGYLTEQDGDTFSSCVLKTSLLKLDILQ